MVVAALSEAINHADVMTGTSQPDRGRATGRSPWLGSARPADGLRTIDLRRGGEPSADRPDGQADRETGQVVEHVGALAASLEGRDKELCRFDGEGQCDREDNQDGSPSWFPDHPDDGRERDEQDDVEAGVVDMQELTQRRKPDPREIACPTHGRDVQITTERRQGRRDDHPEPDDKPPSDPGAGADPSRQRAGQDHAHQDGYRGTWQKPGKNVPISVFDGRHACLSSVLGRSA